MPSNEFTPGREEAAIIAYDDALDSGASPGRALAAVIARYPECAALLGDYALTRSAEPSMSMDTAALEERILARADTLLADRAQMSAKPIAGLIAAIKAASLDLSSTARALGIGVSVLTKLDRRLIAVGTVPRRLVDHLAAEIGASAADIWAYLSAPKTLGLASDYRSESAPKLKDGGEDFAGAIATARRAGEMAASDAAAWTDSVDLGPPRL